METPTEHRSWVFFYGAYMSVSVLRDVGLIPEENRIARLGGFRLDIAPRANIKRDPVSSVWGIAAAINHDDMKRLHTGSPAVFSGNEYYPIAVLVFDKRENIIPALCYTCHEMEPHRPDSDYVESIAAPAEEYGFPDDYVDSIRRFAW